MKDGKPKILVLFYSMYGHIFRMAQAVVEGVREAVANQFLNRLPKLFRKDFGVRT